MKFTISLPTIAEAYVYFIALFCGISLMMPVNAIFSAPTYIMNYYKYATHSPDAVPQFTNFWNNVLTYYNLISLVTSLVVEPLTLTPFFRRINLTARMLSGIVILIAEIILLLVVAASGTSEGGAVTTICVSGLIAGSGKSIFEATVYGMFGAFPPRFLSTVMGGAGLSGVITSTLQMIVKGALPESYEGIRKQSFIYYGLDVGLQGITFIGLILLRYNSFARAQLKGAKREANQPTAHPDTVDMLDDAVLPERKRNANGVSEEEPHEAAGKRTMEADGTIVRLSDPNSEAERETNDGLPQEVRLASKSIAAVDSSQVVEDEGAGALSAARIIPVLRRTIWMAIACGFNFLVTLMLFPTVVVSVDPAHYWYGTIIVLIFNISDLFGRFTPSIRFTWPKTEGQRWIILAASFARLVFLPLLLLASYHYIPSHAYNYVMMIIFGYSNGYIGSMAMVLGPRSRGVVSNGERFVAGTIMGISILCGATIGTAFSIMIQTIREKKGG